MKKNVLIRSAAFLAVFALAAAIVWGLREHARAERSEALADEYVLATVSACARCGEELAAKTREMSLGLEKLRVSGSKTRRVLALEDIVRSSAEAVGLMTRLPCSQVDIMELEAFVTRAGDYARTLSKRLLAGGDTDETDEAQLESMLSACRSLAELAAAKLENGSMPTGTEDMDYYEPTEAEYPEMPRLVYDGELSSGAEDAPEVFLGDEVGEGEAQLIVEKLIGRKFTLAGKTSGRLPAYVFDSEGAEALVTVSGGRLLSFMAEPSSNKEGAPEEGEYQNLVSAAKAFLKKAGYPDTEPVASEFTGGSAVLTFVSRRGGILIYNDAVKVWIDRGTGSPIGLDAEQYLLYGSERNIPGAKLTREEALELISDRLAVKKVRLALLPVSPSREALCYEIRAALEDSEYLVYINAENGGEELILKLTEDGMGIRTE